VLATGLTDVLPDLPGFREAWGREVAACPFCHGHELAGRRIGLVGEGPHVPKMVAMLAPIAAEVLTFGSDEVVAVEPIGDGLLLRLRAGEPVEVAGLFAHSAFEQSAPFADQLGLEMLP